MIEIRKCTIDEVESCRNFPVLAREYAEDAAIHGLPSPVEKLDTYRAIEKLKIFQGYAAVLDGEIVGFMAILVPIIPHYGIGVAVMESMFVGRAYRSSGAGLKLIKAAERHAVEAGSPGLLLSAPYGGRLEKVLPRRGYRATNTVFFKAVDKCS